MARRSIVLHVEDQDLFHLAVEEGLEDAGVVVDLCRAHDGATAVQYLLDPSKSWPDLILLDLIMFPQDGFWFLEEVSTWAPPLRDRLKVAVLTTSADEADQLKSASYLVQPVAVFQKPLLFEDLVGILEQLGHFIEE